MEAKTFAQIWAETPKQKRYDLKLAIMRSTRVSDVAIYNWHSRGARPKAYSTQRDVAIAINEILNIETTPETLFPEEAKLIS